MIEIWHYFSRIWRSNFKSEWAFIADNVVQVLESSDWDRGTPEQDFLLVLGGEDVEQILLRFESAPVRVQSTLGRFDNLVTIQNRAAGNGEFSTHIRNFEFIQFRFLIKHFEDGRQIWNAYVFVTI